MTKQANLLLASFFSLFSSLTYASDTLSTQESNEVKSAMKSNGVIVHNQTQKSVDSFHDMFQDGNFYGRLRSNNFYFRYNAGDSSHDTHLVDALGASLVYNSALYNGFDFNIGLYGSQSFFDDNNDPINYLKPGKDTLSRYDYANTGSKSLVVIGQATIGYKLSKTKFILGRQLVETFYTKSNDTKMIPNTFDGLVVKSTDIADTKIIGAYLYKQKLRDHADSHSVFMVGDANSTDSLRPEWSENDDSAMHKGLTYTALKAAGKPTDAPLLVLDVQNKSIKNLKINFSSYIVPELLGQMMGELNYKLAFKGFSITPGFRYIQQFDNGAGAVGGASIYLKGLDAYEDPNSLDAKMIAARVVTRVGDYKINLGYTNILDEADLVTPWRGFPTAGYTRSMGMYNWRANNKSYRLEVVKGATKSGVYTTPFIQTSVLYIDGDVAKGDTQSMFYYCGLIQNLPSMPEFQYRVRVGYRDFVKDSSSISSYVDSRLEFNYLF
jgi:hypothetical protein